METPLVSVIIPVYNTEEYLRETLECICAQTLREIEILVIDDGSTDRSPEIIGQIAQQDSRIKIYSQHSNRGPSVSRNLGVSEAKGEYIYFMDSDDLLAPEALEVCYRKCNDENLDFVFFDAVCISDDVPYTGQNYIHRARPGSQIAAGTEWLRYQLDTFTFRVTVWLNFIRHDYLRRTGLRFCPGIIHEDQLYTLSLYLNASKAGYLPRTFARHRLRANSIMAQPFSWKNMEGYFTTFREIFRYKKNRPADIQKLIDRYFHITLNAVIWQARTLTFRQKMHTLRICIREGYFPYLQLRNLAVLLLRH